ncbi:hypothetical protein ACFYRC_34260 [Streptomyces sp. NPDC005279]|uniref:hypothetical protein n=1 Tax=Streptomyces sp. NPDC005279 TaxID=3364712 RepID=UPI0036CADEEE
MVGAQDGVVEAQGEFEDGLGDGDAGKSDLGAQQLGAVFDVLGGAGVADERGGANVALVTRRTSPVRSCSASSISSMA